MTFVVLIHEPPAKRVYDDERLAELRRRVPNAQISYVENYQQLIARLPLAHVVAGEIKEQDFLAAKQLRWIHTWAAGPDRLMYGTMRRSRVMVTCSRGNGAVPLAEHAMMLMLLLNRQGVRSIHAQAEGRWDPFMHDELNGRTCGIIGLGNAGQDLALKAKAFHMRVIGVRRHPKPTPHVDQLLGPDKLDLLLEQSDVVVVASPLTDATRGMIGLTELRRMKSSATLICFSRGGIVNESALVRALRDGWIAGAGIDAFASEPIRPASPLWSAPNLISTPHNGAWTWESARRAAAVFEDNLERFAAGQGLRELVDKAAGYL